MPDKNKILPKENLSTRERVARRIATFGMNPWTLTDLNRTLRPRLKLDTLRFHVENLVNNLYVEKLPRKGREKQLYVYRDVLKEMRDDPELSGLALETLNDLVTIAKQIRSGFAVSDAELLKYRYDIGEEVDELYKEYENLAKLHDCLDLWNPVALVERLGFTDDE